MNSILFSYFLASRKKTELEKQNVKVPNNFITKPLLFNLMAPENLILSYVMIDLEAKKLITQKAIEKADSNNDEKKTSLETIEEGPSTEEDTIEKSNYGSRNEKTK